MRVTMCQRQFVELIATGKKNQTIRPRGKRRPVVGEQRSLRHWEGLAYRSKQREIGAVTLVKVVDVEITEEGPIYEGVALCGPEMNAFAREDGFADWEQMHAWFDRHYQLPVAGVLMGWIPLQMRP